MASPLSPDFLPSSTPVHAKPPVLAGAPSRLAWNLSRRFLPWQDDEERKFYALQYKYCSLAGAPSRLAWNLSRRFLPWQDDEERKFYALQYKYCSLAGAPSRLAWNLSRRFLPWQDDEERKFYALQYKYCSLAGAPSRLAWNLSRRFLPWQDDEERKFYALQYKCLPPPLFIPLLTLIQLCLFTYYAVREGSISAVVPLDSPLIFRTDRRDEVWRFLLYCLLHAGWWHVAFNAVVQCIVGLPLEMLHGSPRIAAVYAAGVLAGSLGTSVFDSGVYLVGGSGGCYALLAAHVAHVLINYSELDCGLLYIIVAICIGSVDVGYAIWNRYVVTSPTDHPVSYIAHLAGAAAGLSLGVVLLRKFGRGRKEPGCTVAVVLLTWLALGAAAFLYNLTVA